MLLAAVLALVPSTLVGSRALSGARFTPRRPPHWDRISAMHSIPDNTDDDKMRDESSVRDETPVRDDTPVDPISAVTNAITAVLGVAVGVSALFNLSGYGFLPTKDGIFFGTVSETRMRYALDHKFEPPAGGEGARR
jgi:hypothetical protein